MLAGCIHATASFPCQLAGPLIWTQCEPFHLTTARDSVRRDASRSHSKVLTWQ